MVADFISVAGAHRVLTVDLHAGQIQGFFNIPVDNLYASKVLLEYLKKFDHEMVIVSPDAGGTERARGYASKLEATLAIIDKRRDKPNESEVMNVIGDVKGKMAVIVDDMVDTGWTLVNAAEALKEKGARDVIACITHPVLSGSSVEKIERSCLSKLIVTDTIPLHQKAKECKKIEVVSVAGLIGQAIENINRESSVSVLFP